MHNHDSSPPSQSVLFAGLGSIGQRHLRNLRRLSPVARVIAYRVRGDPLPGDLRGEWLTARRSLDEALALGPTAAVIANPTSLHLPVATAAARPMLAQGGGVMVNVYSTYGLVGPDQWLYDSGDPAAPRTYKPVYYPVTKSAVLGLTRYLAAYWAGKNIRVNALTPAGVYVDHDAGFVERYSYRTPLGRMAERSEYCAAMLFLVSDASSYMTGANLVVDGGWTAW